MKQLQILILLVSAATIGFTSCTEEDTLDVSAHQIQSTIESKGTRASDFYSNWEDNTSYRLPSGDILQLPWSPNAGSRFDYNFRCDMHKEDGWIMVSHNLDKVNDYNKSMYNIVLYNQACGDLKVYLFVENNLEKHNTAVWKTYFTGNQGWTSSLNEITLPTPYLYDSTFMWETSIITKDENPTMANGWNVLLMPGLAYNPQSSAFNSLQIDTRGVEKTIVDLTGVTTGELNGKIVSTTYKGNNVQSAASSMITWADGKVTDWAEQHLKISKGSSIIKEAGNFIVKFIQKQGFKIIGNFLGRFSRPITTEQSIRMDMKSSTDISGVFLTETNTGLKPTGIEIGYSKTGVELGAWNLASNPIIYIHPVGVLNNSADGIRDDECSYLFTASGKSKADIVINPELKKHLVSCKVECYPVMYVPKDRRNPKIPQIPAPDYVYNDYGPLGTSVGTTTYQMHIPLGSTIYSNEDYTIEDSNAQGIVTFWHIWNKHGKQNQQMPLYKYMYALENKELVRGGGIKVGCKDYYAKVLVTMVVEFEGKRDTVVSSRTYLPRFDWDPDMTRKYSNTSLSLLQGLAAKDPVLSKIDNGYYDSLLRANSPYSAVRNDSSLMEKKKSSKLIEL